MTELDQATGGTFDRFRFDRAALDKLRAILAAGKGTGARERIQGKLEGPEPSQLVELPSRDSEAGRELAELGRSAIARGEVGVAVLAGGMATRFGGVVKATVEVIPSYSFLRLKLLDVQRAASATGGTLPILLLASFATSDEIRRAMRAEIQPGMPIEIVDQSVTMRLTESGEVFHDALGRPSPCAPGHGDLLGTLRASGALGRFRRSGGRLLLVSNVDNLAATLDPRVIGAHLRSGKSVTVENVRKVPGDRGGIPARVDGRLQIVEQFRLPEGFDADQVPFFNTNTFVFDAEAMDRDFELDWFLVRRKVEGKEVVQPEQLLGQVTAHLPTQFLVVPRSGPEGRFLPVKDREELQQRMPEIQGLMRMWGVA